MRRAARMERLMDIYQRLKDDHGKQRGLAAALLETSGDSDDRRRLYDAMKAEMHAHADAEEQIFYAALIEHPDTQEQTRHSIAEHKEANDMLKELDKIEMSSGAWLQKFKSVWEALEHHLDEEEKDVFPMSRDVIEEGKAETMAAQFNDRKKREMKEEDAA